MLDALNAKIVEMLGPLGPLFVIGFLGAVLILLTLPILLKRERDPFNKLQEDTKARTQNAGDAAYRTGEASAPDAPGPGSRADSIERTNAATCSKADTSCPSPL